ncbi:hypothetical protein [Stenotrophomonas maltophilia]|uniref:hypothetical protein n=1 Tax=Stenotrophomonas maltophilia TaxID=40324 RepID=UPI000F66B265|nr:hypothetical protein [Stenotrophomonas maltophilia]RRU74120.1 hypothetical protein EGJ89_07310 [Stenotrophomonas maltophilia]
MKTNDKTLADVQPGGRVRLGDSLPPIREDEPLRGDEPVAEQHDARMYNRGWNACREAAAALSAKPSPGGQDALAEAARRVLNDIDSGDFLGAISDATYTALKEALAARQPVGEPVGQVRTRVDGGFIAELLPGVADRVSNFAPLYTAPPAQQPAQVYLDGLDSALGEAIDQRDRYHEVADDLAGHLARITGADIGEHSSANCPWQNAIEAAEEYKPAQAVDLGQFREYAAAAVEFFDHGYDGHGRAKLNELLAMIDKAVGK